MYNLRAEPDPIVVTHERSGSGIIFFNVLQVTGLVPVVWVTAHALWHIVVLWHMHEPWSMVKLHACRRPIFWGFWRAFWHVLATFCFGGFGRSVGVVEHWFCNFRPVGWFLDLGFSSSSLGRSTFLLFSELVQAIFGPLSLLRRYQRFQN